MNDNLFNKIEQKTNVNKDTIISLARKLQDGNYKDENTLKDIIHELSFITGREVSEEKEKNLNCQLRQLRENLERLNIRV